jgi:hypothetical protein
MARPEGLTAFSRSAALSRLVELTVLIRKF